MDNTNDDNTNSNNSTESGSEDHHEHESSELHYEDNGNDVPEKETSYFIPANILPKYVGSTETIIEIDMTEVKFQKVSYW